MKQLLNYLVCLLMMNSCSYQDTNHNTNEGWQVVPLSYAKGFTIEKSDFAYRVKVLTPFKGSTTELTYIFSNQEDKVVEYGGDIIITPINKIVCTSTTHIPLLDYLGETESLAGFPTLDYISSKEMRPRINSGEVMELGIDEALNIEKLIEINPDLLMTYSLNGDFGQVNLIKEAGIPVIINAEYLEQHPLGRAEWIKLTGILFNKEKKADSVFSAIVNEYLSTKSMLEDTQDKPSVLSGVMYGDSWYLPGGRNYASTLLSDAGYTFFWEQDTSSAFLPISFETVYNSAHSAQYWIGVASYRSLDELNAGDSRYGSFNAYNNTNVYSYNKIIGEKGGSMFLELGYLRPDLILKDLVKIAHPDILPEHELFFHYKLP